VKGVENAANDVGNAFEDAANEVGGAFEDAGNAIANADHVIKNGFTIVESQILNEFIKAYGAIENWTEQALEDADRELRKAAELYLKCITS
jgi:hypothetical protein